MCRPFEISSSSDDRERPERSREGLAPKTFVSGKRWRGGNWGLGQCNSGGGVKRQNQLGRVPLRASQKSPVEKGGENGKAVFQVTGEGGLLKEKNKSAKNLLRLRGNLGG